METGNRTTVARLQSISDDSLATNISGKFHLAIQSGEGILSWTLLNTTFNKYLALESISYSKTQEDNLLDEITKSAWFPSVKSYSLGVVSAKSILVPEPLYSENTREDYLAFHFGRKNKQDVIFSNKLLNAGCYCIFSVPENIVQLYRYFFPEIKIMHCSVPLIENILLDNKNENSEKVTLNIRTKIFELLVTKGGALVYYNVFSYQAKEDVIYYLLFACEQLKLNPENIALQLSGDIEKNSPLYSIIHTYIRNVSFMARNAGFDYSYRFSELSNQTFYSLFSQYKCV